MLVSAAFIELQKGLPVFTSWRRENFSVGGRDVSVRLVPITQVSQAVVDRWLDLESRAEQGNMFLSPLFVLPAVRLLTRQRVLLLKIFHHDGDHDQLVGLATVVARPPMPRFPLPHLEAYRSPHTFLTGMLLDRNHRRLALDALRAYLSASRSPWCGIRFESVVTDEHFDRANDSDLTTMARWNEQYRYRRAILTPSNAAAIRDSVLASGHFGKELRRKRRRLEEMGKVEWRLLSGRDVSQEVIETFLRLENQGWKAERGTSLLSNAAEADFFRAMSAGFANEGRAFFTELTLGGRVIASTSNFISGTVGFAFKIGWDQEFAAVSPGFLNELELMRHADKFLTAVDFVDSGASEGAFIERLWRDRREVATGILTGGYAGAAIQPVMSFVRRIKRGMS